MRIGLGFGFGPLRIYVPLNKRRRARYWTHPGCRVHHTRQDTADACARRMRGH